LTAVTNNTEAEFKNYHYLAITSECWSVGCEFCSAYRTTNHAPYLKLWCHLGCSEPLPLMA